MKSAITISLVAEAKSGPFVFSNLSEGIANAAQLGFDGVELFPGAADEVDKLELKRLLQRHQIKLAAVGTGAGWLRHKLRLTDPDREIRRRAQNFIAEIIDLAGGFGASAIIGSMQGRCEGNVPREQALGWMAEALEQLGPRAHAQDVHLLLEPLNRYETNLLNSVADSLGFLRSLRTQNVYVLGDLFHMNIEEVDMPTTLRLGGAKLGHVHFADSNRRAVGLGHTSMEPICRALKEIGYEGYLSAEVFPLPDASTAAEQTIKSFRRLVSG